MRNADVSNVEALRDYFLGKDPQLKETMADNSLRLIGIPGKYFVLKSELLKGIDELNKSIDNLKKDIEFESAVREGEDERLHQDISAIERDMITLQDVETLLSNYYTKSQVDDIISHIQTLKLEVVEELPAVGRTDTIYLVPNGQSAGNIYDEYIYVNDDWEQIGTTQVDLSNYYTKEEIDSKVPQNTAEVIEDITTSPSKVVNPETFYRFKNLIDNSSFEVFNGQTKVPYGWTGGVVDSQASMFGTYSLKIEQGNTAQIISRNQPDVTWAEGAYDSDKLILAFYHKFGGVNVAVYDIENAGYLSIQQLDSTLEPVDLPATSVELDYKANWDKNRDYILIVPDVGTKKIRVELTCPVSGTREVYIDGMSLEPYEEGEYPSIYKDGRYSLSAYQLLEPPVGDATRWINLDHFSIANSVADNNGNLTYQELLREDGSLAIKREASNPDANGNYQTYVETFYLADGISINYVDTYTYTYSSTGAIISKTMTTTEV